MVGGSGGSTVCAWQHYVAKNSGKTNMAAEKEEASPRRSFSHVIFDMDGLLLGYFITFDSVS